MGIFNYFDSQNKYRHLYWKFKYYINFSCYILEIYINKEKPYKL